MLFTAHTDTGRAIHVPSARVISLSTAGINAKKRRRRQECQSVGYPAIINAQRLFIAQSWTRTQTRTRILSLLLIRSLSTEPGSARCSHVRTVTETFLRFLFPCRGLLHVHRNTGRTDYRETRRWLAGDKVTSIFSTNPSSRRIFRCKYFFFLVNEEERVCLVRPERKLERTLRSREKVGIEKWTNKPAEMTRSWQNVLNVHCSTTSTIFQKIPWEKTCTIAKWVVDRRK